MHLIFFIWEKHSGDLVFTWHFNVLVIGEAIHTAKTEIRTTNWFQKNAASKCRRTRWSLCLSHVFSFLPQENKGFGRVWFTFPFFNSLWKVIVKDYNYWLNVFITFLFRWDFNINIESYGIWDFRKFIKCIIF